MGRKPPLGTLRRKGQPERREAAMSGHSANINERPIETKRTVNQRVSTTAAPAGYPRYTDESVSPLPARQHGHSRPELGMAGVGPDETCPKYVDL